MPHGLFSEGRDYDGIDLEGLESVGRSHMRSLEWWDLLGAILGPRTSRIPLLGDVSHSQNSFQTHLPLLSLKEQ